MFCPRCGQELIEGALFCSSCGTKLDFLQNRNESREETSYDRFLPEEPEIPEEDYAVESDEVRSGDYETDLNDYYNVSPAPKKNRKPLIIALCIVAAALIVGVAVYASGIIGAGSPESKLKSASEKTMSAISGRSEVTSFFYDLKDAEKAGVTIRAENLGNMLSSVSPYMSYLNLDAEIAAAGDKKGNISATLDVNAFGSKIRAGYFAADNGDSDIVVDVPSVLENPHGISLKTIGVDMDDSILAPGSGSDYELPEEYFEETKSALESVAKIGKAASGLDLDEFIIDLQKDEAAKIEFEKSKAETDVGDGSVKCDVYTTSIDEKKISAIIKHTQKWLESKGLMEDNEMLNSIISSVGMGSVSPEEFFERAIDEVEDIDVEVDIQCFVYKGYLVKTALTGEIENRDLKMEMTFGSDPSKTDEVVIVLEVDDSDLTVRLDLSEADRNCFSVSMKSKENGLNAKAGFEYDAAKSEFELTANAGSDYNVVLIGSMKIGKDSIVISDPEFRYSRYMMDLSLDGLSVEITKTPTIKKIKDEYPGGYTNILRLSEKDFEELSDIISGLGSSIGSMF